MYHEKIFALLGYAYEELDQLEKVLTHGYIDDEDEMNDLTLEEYHEIHEEITQKSEHVRALLDMVVQEIARKEKNND